jgi:hypothetical protein
VFGAMTPAGSAKVTLRDTDIDTWHAELAGKVAAGTCSRRDHASCLQILQDLAQLLTGIRVNTSPISPSPFSTLKEGTDR